MSTQHARFGAFRERVLAALSQESQLPDAVDAFHDFAGDFSHPAALLDAGMVYLAMNVPYSRMERQPPSALVGKEYSQVHKNRRDALSLLKALVQGEPQELSLTEPQNVEDGGRYRRRLVTPIVNAQSQALGMLLEVYPENHAPHGGTD